MSAAKKKTAAKPRAAKKTAPKETKTRRTKSLEQVQAEGHGVSLSLTQVAEEFGRDWETVKKWINQLDIRPSGERSGHPVYRLRDLLRMERVDEQGELDPSKLRSMADRRAYWQAERERDDLLKSRRELYRRGEIEAEWSRVLKIIKLQLSILPDQLERDLQLSPVALSQIENAIEAVCEQMYDQIAQGEILASVPEGAAAEVDPWSVGP